MPIALDITTDLTDVADGAESVTLRRRGSTLAAAASALRRAISTREAQASGGRYTSSDVAWHLPIAALAAAPAVGDAIGDAAGVRWTILEVQQSIVVGRWRCLARNLAVAHGLNELVRIERAVWSKDAAGAATPTWQEEHGGLAARIQPQSAAVAIDADRMKLVLTHRVFVAEPVAVDENLRVVDADGRTYRVVGCEQPERIDALLILNVIAEPA